MGKPKIRENLEAKRLARRAQDLMAANIPADAAILPSGQDVEVTRAGRNAAHDQARRQDAFMALRDGFGAGHYDAVRRLERDMLVRIGAGDRGPLNPRVDGDRRHDYTDIQVMAGQRVDQVLSRIGMRDRWLITELLKPALPDRPSWRDAVFYVTGEANHHAQGAAVRMAVANLYLAYQEVDGLSRAA